MMTKTDQNKMSGGWGGGGEGGGEGRRGEGVTNCAKDCYINKMNTHCPTPCTQCFELMYLNKLNTIEGE